MHGRRQYIQFCWILHAHGITEQNVNLATGYMDTEFSKTQISAEGWLSQIWKFVGFKTHRVYKTTQRECLEWAEWGGTSQGRWLRTGLRWDCVLREAKEETESESRSIPIIRDSFADSETVFYPRIPRATGCSLLVDFPDSLWYRVSHPACRQTQGIW